MLTLLKIDADRADAAAGSASDRMRSVNGRSPWGRRSISRFRTCRWASSVRWAASGAGRFRPMRRFLPRITAARWSTWPAGGWGFSCRFLPTNRIRRRASTGTIRGSVSRSRWRTCTRSSNACRREQTLKPGLMGVGFADRSPISGAATFSIVCGPARRLTRRDLPSAIRSWRSTVSPVARVPASAACSGSQIRRRRGAAQDRAGG